MLYSSSEPETRNSKGTVTMPMKNGSRESTLPIVAEGGHTTETEILERIGASPISCILVTVSAFLFMLHIALFAAGHVFLAALSLTGSTALFVFCGKKVKKRVEHLRATHTCIVRAQVVRHLYSELEKLVHELADSLYELLPCVTIVEYPNITAAEIVRHMDRLRGYQTTLEEIRERYTEESRIITIPEHEARFLNSLETDIEICLAFAEKIEEEIQTAKPLLIRI